MLNCIVGIVVLMMTAALIYALRARNGVTHPLVSKPFLAEVIPLALVCGMVFGVGLIVAGTFG